MSTLSVRLPESVYKATKLLAKEDHVSINHFITLAVLEKISALGTEKFLEERARKGNREMFLNVLKNSPNVEPDEVDKL